MAFIYLLLMPINAEAMLSKWSKYLHIYLTKAL